MTQDSGVTDSFGSKGTLDVAGTSYEVFQLSAVDGAADLPYSLKVLLENLLRTDPDFARSWAARQEAIARATTARLERQRAAGVVRDDVPLPLLADFLRLVFDGLVSSMAAGMPTDHLDGVLDLVEDAVRRPVPVDAHPADAHPAPQNVPAHH